MKRIALIGALVFCAAACTRTALENAQPGSPLQQREARTPGNAQGPQNTMQAYYDSTLFTINMKELPSSGNLIAHNGSLNEIYVSNNLDSAQTYIPVIDAIQGDGFNPLWSEEIIVFNAGYTPHQFYSDTQIDAAVASGEITLNETGDVYRCSVVGHH